MSDTTTIRDLITGRDVDQAFLDGFSVVELDVSLPIHILSREEVGELRCPNPEKPIKDCTLEEMPDHSAQAVLDYKSRMTTGSFASESDPKEDIVIVENGVLLEGCHRSVAAFNANRGLRAVRTEDLATSSERPQIER